jgi:hypothetical protein
VFSQFQRVFQDRDTRPSAEELAATHQLVAAAAAIYQTEKERTTAIMPLLSKLIGYDLINVRNEDQSISDGVAISNCSGKSATVALAEKKNELGTGGSDPTIQGALSYRKTWIQKSVRHGPLSVLNR